VKFFGRTLLLRAASYIAVAAALSGPTSLLGCAGSPGGEQQTNVKTFKREQNPQRLVELGKGFAGVGDLTRAEQYFAAAIEQGGDERAIIPMLLRVCVQDGRYRVAIEYAENFLRKHPNDVRTRFVLATLYQAVGDAPAARAQLLRVIDVHPDEAEAHFALAILMRDSQEDPLVVDRHFREYLRLKPAGSHAEEAQSSLLKSVPQ
jgi:tetratricopeptide (TPR) repeat protein